MDDPLRLLLTNAGAAGLIALLAWAASFTVRRQAVVHGLWLLALARLVVPPIAPLPLMPAWPGLSLASRPLEPTVVAIPPVADPEVVVRAPAKVERPLTRPRMALASRRSLPSPPVRPRPGLRAATWLALATGALGISLLTLWRFARFSRHLAFARPAPEPIEQRVAVLASRLGLRRVPPVLLVPARIPPMLWPHRGGPRLLLPAGLLPVLAAEELEALLAHELAHVRRRDHWVRLVELAATALFWWYPVTWWARSALRRAEERCCDEWVLRLLPRSAAAYANGLLKSLTFIADRPGPLPSVASGAGPVEDLEARLKEILMTRPVPQLAVPLRLALAAAAFIGLAVFPTHAQSSAAKDEPTAPVAEATPAIATTPAPAARPGTSPRPGARPATTPRPAARRAAPPAVIAGVEGGIVGGVPGGIVGGVPGGVVGGVPGGVVDALSPVAAPFGLTPPPALAPRPGLSPLAPVGPRAALAPASAFSPTPQAQPAPAPEPAIAARTRSSNPARRALEDQRRALEEQRRQLQRQELELQGKQIELEARAEQAELRATAELLRAEGHADEAARAERQLTLSGRRAELQERQLGLEVERAALEAKLEADVAAQQARVEALEESGHQAEAEDAQRELERADAAREQVEQELQKKQQAIETEMMDAEKQMRALAAEDQVRAMRDATEDLARSLAEQIESLKQAAAEAPSQKAAVEREIQRLRAALDALQSGSAPKTLPRKTSRPQP